LKKLKKGDLVGKNKIKVLCLV